MGLSILNCRMRHTVKIGEMLLSIMLNRLASIGCVRKEGTQLHVPKLIKALWQSVAKVDQVDLATALSMKSENKIIKKRKRRCNKTLLQLKLIIISLY
jgi:hypothetical protein